MATYIKSKVPPKAPKRVKKIAGPSLMVLPLSQFRTFDNETTTVRDAREALKETAIVLDKILNAPYGYPAGLRQMIQDVQFHVNAGLSLADVYIGAGYYQSDPIEDVEGLESCIYNHMQTINKAKAMWNYWIKTEKAKVGPSAVNPVTTTVALVPTAKKMPAKRAVSDYDLGYDLGYDEEDEDFGCVDCLGYSGGLSEGMGSGLKDMSTPDSWHNYVALAVVGGLGLLLLRIAR